MGKKGEKRVFDISHKEKDMTFFISKSKDGHVFGIKSPNIGDVHITIIADEVKGFNFHISDKRVGGENNRPLEKEIDYSDILIAMTPLMSNMNTVDRNAYDQVYVLENFPQVLIDGANSDNNDRHLDFQSPNVIFEMIEDMFRNRENVKLIGLNELSIHNWFGIVEENDVVQIVIPSTTQQFYKFDIDDFSAFLDDVVHIIGLEEYMDYIKPDLD